MAEKKKTFEQAMTRLEEIVALLEKGEAPLEESLKLSKPLRELYEGDEQVKALIDTARSIEGMPRHASTHAAGVVITRLPVVD